MTDSALIVDMHGIDQFLSFRKRIEAPLTHVAGAVVGSAPEVREVMRRTLCLPGAYMPGSAIAGSFLEFKEKIWLFYNTRGGENAITIMLAHEHYQALVVEVADPAGTVAAINMRAGAQGAGAQGAGAGGDRQ